MKKYTYIEMQAIVFMDALTEGYNLYGEANEEDVYQHANEAIAEWSNEFPVSSYDFEDHI